MSNGSGTEIELFWMRQKSLDWPVALGRDSVRDPIIPLWVSSGRTRPLGGMPDRKVVLLEDFFKDPVQSRLSLDSISQSNYDLFKRVKTPLCGRNDPL